MPIVLGLGALFLTASATATAEPEVVFRGNDIELAKSFQCGGRMPQGKYALEILSDTDASTGPILKVSRGEKTLCEVVGKPGDPSYDGMKPKKVRVFTRVNTEAKALQIDLAVPDDLRQRIPNRTFLLPLAAGH